MDKSEEEHLSSEQKQGLLKQLFLAIGFCVVLLVVALFASGIMLTGVVVQSMN